MLSKHHPVGPAQLGMKSNLIVGSVETSSWSDTGINSSQTNVCAHFLKDCKHFLWMWGSYVKSCKLLIHPNSEVVSKVKAQSFELLSVLRIWLLPRLCDKV